VSPTATINKNNRKTLFEEVKKASEIELKPALSADRSAARPTRFSSDTEICGGCEKRVYPMDLMSACDKSWHRGCFKCTHCKMTLNMKTFAAIAGDPYCKAHYMELFKSSGGSYGSFTGEESHRNFDATSAFKGMY